MIQNRILIHQRHHDLRILFPCFNMGGPTIHGRVPKAQEAAPSIPDDTLHVILVLHPHDETSCRRATRRAVGPPCFQRHP